MRMLEEKQTRGGGRPTPPPACLGLTGFPMLYVVHE